LWRRASIIYYIDAVFLLLSFSQVLPRVHYLYQHLTTRSIISNAKTMVHQERSAETDQTSLQPVVADTVSTTIARLLSFVPDESLCPCIITDLVDLLVDLSVVVETGLLGRQQSEGSVQIVIFNETALTSSQLPENAEYTVDVTSTDVVLSLQAGTFQVLETFLVDLQKKRLEPQPETLSGAGTCTASLISAGNVDLVFYGIGNDGELVSSLFSAMRQVLLSQPRTECNPSVVLWMRTKLAALRLLTKLVQDWHDDECPLLNTLVEAGILVARAIQTFLGSILPGQVWVECAKLLADLATNVFLFPPRVKGTTSVLEVHFRIRLPAVTILLDCLKLVGNASECNRGGVLDLAVVRTVHAMLYTVDLQEGHAHLPGVSLALTYCASEGIFGHMFRLLKDSVLSGFVVWIIMALLDPVQTSVCARATEMERICRLACQGYNNQEMASTTNKDQEMVANDSNDPMEVVEDTPKPGQPGSKRKRRSVSPKKDSLARPAPLEIETSPSKRRGPQNVATPSPRTGADFGTDDHYEYDESSVQTFLDEALREFLIDALGATKRLTENFEPGETMEISHEDTHGQAEQKGKSTITEDATLVLSGTRLLMCILKQRLTPAAENAGDFEATLTLLVSFSKCFQKCCNSLLPCVNDNSRFSSTNRFVANVVVTCGLHAQFTVEPALRKMKIDSVKSLCESLDSFSSLGAHMCRSDLLSETQSTAHSRELHSITPSCSKLWTSLTSVISLLPGSEMIGNEHCEHSALSCSCSLFALDTSLETDQEEVHRILGHFRNDCAISVFDSLPAKTRCVPFHR
jgi:hypothetical protein